MLSPLTAASPHPKAKVIPDSYIHDIPFSAHRRVFKHDEEAHLCIREIAYTGCVDFVSVCETSEIAFGVVFRPF